MLPSTRQSAEHFDAHFEKEDLSLLVKFRRAQENAATKKKIREEIDELIQQEASNEEIIDVCKERAKTTTLTDVDITVLVSLVFCQKAIDSECTGVCYCRSCGGV